MQRILLYLQLMRFDRPIGIYLLLYPTLWAVWLAANLQPSIKIIVIFILGVVIMRAAGCVINDIADRHFDPHVERTKNRPLASKRITLTEAIILFIVLMLIALLLLLQLNRYAVYIGIIAAILSMLYPFAKRMTHLPQLLLSLTFKIGILIAFAAQLNQLPSLAWLLYLTAILWMIGYDTMYALTDRNDDIKLGLKSTAILFGKQVKNVILGFQLSFLVGLIAIGRQANLHWVYWFSLIIVIMLCIYQQYLMRKYGDQSGFNAFHNNHWVGLVVFIGILLGNV